ncbi:sulfatase [Vibrio sp. SCSIO 43132]|uniref:sulfatase n=1 Tax=Vibrio sp. SCSIO 43132 TaxID=2779363 RepID=UPI001CA80C24|nr:sulfatase [Vibrio sp. SCSIO 43132]UAB72318.1 sulfatase [Vibrio sp. SCSIO 43132]
MKTIFVVFDSLNRLALGCYGSEYKTPNFDRLARKSVVFDRHFVGSLPCMPARRDLHTGRLSFLHRSWGPLEPFDISLFDRLREEGVYSHLITDHYHYFEDGAGNYHTRYDSYGYLRGQEGDKWVPTLDPLKDKWQSIYHEKQVSFESGSLQLQNMANRERIVSEEDFSSTQCFDEAISFLERYSHVDSWVLQLETFDPHEPFVAPPGYRAEFQQEAEKIYDWPPYDRFVEGLPENELLCENYKALVAHCDTQLGRLLDKIDELDAWKDTAIIVTTDHGFLLGEHNWWAKNRMPCYNEVAHIPLFVFHPQFSHLSGTRCEALTQTTDIAPTLLDCFGLPAEPEAASYSLLDLLSGKKKQLHESIIYGYFGGAVNLTDGRYTYFRYPTNMDSADLNEYTLMPSHMLGPFSKEELGDASLKNDLAFAGNVPVLKIPVREDTHWYGSHGPGGMKDCHTVIYDLKQSPTQEVELADKAVENNLEQQLVRLLKKNHAPDELYKRLALIEERNHPKEG